MPALVVITMIQVVLSGGVFVLGAGAESCAALFAPARWGMAALASTINLNVIGPPTGPTKTIDLLWRHTAYQWSVDMAFLIVIGLICLGVTAFRLSKIGPRRRKPARVDRQPATPEPVPVRSVYS
jgi:hypothetical protein